MNAIVTLKSLETIKTTDFIFSLIEKEFDKWYFHNSKYNQNIKLVYYGNCEQKALATKKNAILEAIEWIKYYMEDEQIDFMFWDKIKKLVDFEGAFEI